MSRFIDIIASENTPRIPDIIAAQTCQKHEASKQQPCWQIWTLAGHKLSAICNTRAKRAGYDGDISEAALGDGRNYA